MSMILQSAAMVAAIVAAVAGAKRGCDHSDMKLAKYLANLGYGSRRYTEKLIVQRRVTRADGSPLDDSGDPNHEDVRVDGEPLDPPAGSVLMLHKPVGYVCSTRDHSPVVYALLPDRFRHRSPLMSPVGRLDLNTSGLLLLTDDGQLNHRITSPRAHLRKCYEVALASALRGDEFELFASGTLVLESEMEPLRPAHLEQVGERAVRITLTEGRYHQVRRMFAATGNHVVSLHRSAIGSLRLGSLALGTWRVLSLGERADVFTEPAASPPAAP